MTKKAKNMTREEWIEANADALDYPDCMDASKLKPIDLDADYVPDYLKKRINQVRDTKATKRRQ